MTCVRKAGTVWRERLSPATSLVSVTNRGRSSEAAIPNPDSAGSFADITIGGKIGIKIASAASYFDNFSPFDFSKATKNDDKKRLELPKFDYTFSHVHKHYR